MSSKHNLTKEQLIKIIENLEKEPHDRVGVLADVGIAALGAVGGGATAAVLGTTTASIPVVTALTGLGMVVAAPVALVAGAAVASGAAIYGVSRLIKDGGFNEGKRKQLLTEYTEALQEIEAKERQSNLNEQDKTKFYSFLKEPLRCGLIAPDDAQKLMQAVESGDISLSEAYKLIGQLLSEDSTTPFDVKSDEKIVTICPNCSQKLRAPSHLGKLTLTCPKCRHSWSWDPK